MSRWWIYLALLTGAFLIPKQPVELGKLIPVELILIEKQMGEYWIHTDTGNGGTGLDVQSAIRELQETASGDLFLDTARFLVVTEGAADAVGEISAQLKPKTYLCMADEGIDPEQAAEYLRTHIPKMRVKDRHNGSNWQYLKQIEGKIKLE